MAKQKRKAGDKKFSNTPFKGLALPVAPPGAPTPRPSAAPSNGDPRPASDDELLADAMEGVIPLSDGRKLAEKNPRARPLLTESLDEEMVMRHLDELIHGTTPFDFSDTEEYIEAIQKGVDRKILKKLRRGEYAYQAHLDLHGCNRDQAREKVGAFIQKSLLENRCCVLIVHGRGHGSKDNIPVLKHKLAAWLTRGAIGKRVLAYTSAMPYDGGTGAVYVLLRTP